MPLTPAKPEPNARGFGGESASDFAVDNYGKSIVPGAANRDAASVVLMGEPRAELVAQAGQGVARDSTSAIARRDSRVVLKVAVLTAIWWATSALFSANSKKVLRGSVTEGVDPFLASAMEVTWTGLFWISFVCVGVGIASYHPPFLPAVLISAMVCNAMFGSRTVLIKKFRQASEKGTMDAEMLNIFLSTCVVGCAVVGCLTLIVTAVHSPDEVVLAFQLAWCSATFLSSIYYFSYNLVSFLALEYVTAPSHALLKAGKGLTVLVSAGLFLDEDYSTLQWFGLYLAKLGVTLFSHSKEYTSKKVGTSMQYWTSAAQRASGTSLLAGLSFLAFHGLRDGGMDVVASKVSTAGTWSTSSESQLELPDQDPWFACLSSVRDQQYTSLEEVFARGDIRDSGILVADSTPDRDYESLAAEQGFWSLVRDLGKSSRSVARCQVVEAATARFPTCDETVFSKHKLLLSLGGEDATDRRRRGSLHGQLKLVEFALRHNMTFLAMPRSLVKTKKDRIRRDAVLLREIITSTIGLEKSGRKIIFTWRSRASLELAVQHFHFVDNRFVPDTTLHLAPLVPSKTFASASLGPVDLVFLWQVGARDGLSSERSFTEEWIQEHLNALPDGRGQGVSFRLLDRESMASLDSKITLTFDAELALAQTAAVIASGKVIVSDRLGWSLLALLARKPHVIVGDGPRDRACDAMRMCGVEMRWGERRWFSAGDDEWIMNVPPLGDSITKGEVVEWTKSVGDYCFEDDEIATMETDKVTFPVRVEKPGEIVEIFVEVDSEVKVGEPLVKFKKADAPGGGKPPAKEEEAAPASEPSKPEPSKAESAPAPSAPSSSSSKPSSSPAPKQSSGQSSGSPASNPVPGTTKQASRTEKRVKISPMRRKIAERLVEAQGTAALLTTFNEVDMSGLMKMRKTYKDQFEKVHGVKLGFMSAFVAASTKALLEIPAVNGVIDDKEIVYRDYVDISVAVSAPRGLVVPVLRNCQDMNFADIERTIGEFAAKAREDKLTMEEMAGGTFTITNGGVFGSLFSTPMLNMPQSAILGMHGVKERPVTVNGEIVSRPMMYIALTYDHRLIDGRESVTFLKSIKEKIEDPERLLLGL
ncbi:Dihydrolipoyllysine-residue succinyltransferase component of 2-oxoglutarate dehydrogenase complex, mitochondrial [Hondaea fermentalgiana]|uniref:dihydrolipoyllysine-residue succinyltransferase n=1 Tax=Hondaea fermentalgiana TaxID=2315210 RepID=A0A2R5GNB6_9STRA|nr:Dihydrolipoyllysine-residue succinyltransferase component of 2-oxoglutarate dehydrogenase complex, mitochondrial [Hondaea fermentalgiana]|eukprot:GBG30113.1 Dihydrolipoyllysine-residue succinyltransferase component of 2-oxoglutarate dehydrogenase complex, mitochondrial [Hondaea fermentalgiana]